MEKNNATVHKCDFLGIYIKESEKGNESVKKYRGLLLVCGFLYTLLLFKEWNINTPERKTVIETSENVETQEKPKIAITFDDGPSKEVTPLLLDGLKQRDVKASFFVIGELAEKFPDIIKRAKEEGHVIGNHTYHHVDVTRVSDEKARKEIEQTRQVVKEATGYDTEYVRPPFGIWQKKLEQELDVFPVMWSVDPLDWTTENTDEIVNRVVTKVKENDIILLHDCYKSSVDAALRIIDILQKEGYEFVTVDEMIFD